MIGQLSNHLWQSTVFVVGSAMAAAALRKNGAHVRHLVWLTASLKFLVPFALLMTLGTHWASTRSNAPTGGAYSIKTTSLVVDQIAQPFTAAVRAASPAASSETRWIPAAVVSLWIFGSAVVLHGRLQGWRRIRRALRVSAPVVISGAEVPSGVDVRTTPGLVEPGVVGFWRPILLLPAGIDDHLTPIQLQAVLAHELCHIRRLDNVTAALHMIVESIFWFHPLVWWVGARLVEERERACDEHVLLALGKPEAYAEGILNVCKLYVESPLTCVSGVTGANLKKRIEAIMGNRIGLRLGLGRKFAITFAAILALTAPIVAGMITAPIRMRAQDLGSSQRFSIASVKPCDPSGMAAGQRGGGAPNFVSSPGRITVNCVNAAYLILRAFIMNGGQQGADPINAWPNKASLYDSQDHDAQKVRGGPAWVYADKYSIEAVAPGGANDSVLWGPMLRALLEDRFQLKLHQETEEAPMWALTVAKDGPKFKDGDCVRVEPGKSNIKEISAANPGKLLCGPWMDGTPEATTWKLGGLPVAELTRVLSQTIGATVVDRTGLSGSFNFVFKAGPDDVFAAVQSQLGLKLVQTKGPRGFLVIDHIERPAPNRPFDVLK
jgi:bla regulator protein BlaR1